LKSYILAKGSLEGVKMSMELTTFRTKDLPMKDLIESKLSSHSYTNVCISSAEGSEEDIVNYLIVDDLKIKMKKKKKGEETEGGGME
jgi:hypothetical protein